MDQTNNQSIKTLVYSAVCCERIRKTLRHMVSLQDQHGRRHPSNLTYNAPLLYSPRCGEQENLTDPTFPTHELGTTVHFSA